MTTWKMFVVKPDKTPYPNCPQCGELAAPDHDREACDHLVCHGFYAATDDAERWLEMRKSYPQSHWAVRTGAASGIIVLDAEGGVQSSGQTGVDSLDDFEAWTGGLALPPTDRIAATPSGGVHRYYEYVPGVRGKNRVLPGVDVKSDGGYVLRPFPWGEDETSRHWIAAGAPGQLGADVIAWLSNRRSRSGDGGGGGVYGEAYDYELFRTEGCPAGHRDDFANELLFRLRKSGVSRQEATTIARNHWHRIAQPPNATYYMPWHHWEYKIERIWRTVRADEVTPAQRAWVSTLTTRAGGRLGRVMLSGRGEE